MDTMKVLLFLDSHFSKGPLRIETTIDGGKCRITPNRMRTGNVATVSYGGDARDFSWDRESGKWSVMTT